MSWLSNLMNKGDSGDPLNEKQKKPNLYISVNPINVCFLIVDEGSAPNKIVAWEEFPLGPIENLSVGEPVRDLFGSLDKLFVTVKDRFDSVDNISVSIPADGVFFKHIEIPKIGQSDMQKLLLAEIKKSVPVDFSQVLFAQNDLGVVRDNQQAYFCVGIQKLTFENFKNLFAKYNINPYFEIEVFSLARIIEADDKPKLILHVGRVNTFLIFTKGQIIQDVHLLDMGLNQITKKLMTEFGLSFEDSELLRLSTDILKDNNRMGAKVMQDILKEFDQKLSKSTTAHIMEYEKKHSLELEQVLISGYVLPSGKVREVMHEEFDAELKVDYVNENNFTDFVAENFSLFDLKRFAQCFGLALRDK